MSDNLNEFKADHSGGDVVKGAEVPDAAVAAAGGAVQKRKADLDKDANPTVFENPGAAHIKEEIDLDENWDKGASNRHTQDSTLAAQYKKKAKDAENRAKIVGKDAPVYNKYMSDHHSAMAKHVKHSYHANESGGSKDEAKQDYRAHMGKAKEYRSKLKEETISSLFGNDSDLTEDFKEKAMLVFEAAVNEEASNRTKEITESLEAKFEADLTEAVNESMNEIIENLDSYLDYVVAEWMEENAVAIESGIKVAMAESFMSGLKDLFEAHNVEIDEETIDIVSDLEEQISDLEAKANAAINESIELANEIASLKAERVFNEVTEGLTVPQKERMRVLSEKLDVSDLDHFAADLETLKESFFNTKVSTAKTLNESAEEENEIILEETKPQRVSQFDSVNSIVSFLNSRK